MSDYIYFSQPILLDFSSLLDKTLVSIIVDKYSITLLQVITKYSN